jgi:hypothetical protein
VNVVNSSTITAVTPVHPVGNADVTVTNPDGQSANLAGAYTYTTSGSQLPDLVVTSVSATPAYPSPGQAVTFTAVVKNQGSAPVPAGISFGLAFNIDGKEVTWYGGFDKGIAAGASATLTANSGPSKVSTWTATNGTHSLEAYVNDQGKVSESSNDNNKLSTTLVISKLSTDGDSNGDGHVNAVDLSQVISHIGQSYNQADFNHDGKVTAADLAVMLAHWTW